MLGFFLHSFTMKSVVVSSVVTLTLSLTPYSAYDFSEVSVGTRWPESVDYRFQKFEENGCPRYLSGYSEPKLQ